MIDNQSRLIAWTGQQVNLKAEDKKMTRTQKRRAQRKKAQTKAVMAVTQHPSIALDEEVTCFTSSSREPFRFNGHPAFERQGTREKCSEHNRGRKSVHKDRRFRANGSGKTRAPHTHVLSHSDEL